MGEDQSFWRLWLRGARAFWGVGAAIFGAVLVAGGATLLVAGGVDWLTQHFLSRKFDPNGFVMLGVIAALALLFAPVMLSNRNDERSLLPAWRAKPPASPPRPLAIKIADDFCFLDGVLCEQVRPEKDGQWILIGVYGRAIAVPRFPAKVTISGLINVETMSAFLAPIQARFRLDEREIVRTAIETNGYTGSWTVTLVPRVVDIADAATFHIDLSIDGENWSEVMRKPVIAAEDDE